MVSHSKREAVLVVKQFMGNLTSSQQDYSLTFSLLAIGETGRGADLSQLAELKPAILLTAFNHTSEEVKSAVIEETGRGADLSKLAELKPAILTDLGNIALGNLAEYLPFILHEIETQPRRQYILLQPSLGLQVGSRCCRGTIPLSGTSSTGTRSTWRKGQQMLWQSVWASCA